MSARSIVRAASSCAVVSIATGALLVSCYSGHETSDGGADASSRCWGLDLGHCCATDGCRWFRTHHGCFEERHVCEAGDRLDPCPAGLECSVVEIEDEALGCTPNMITFDRLGVGRGSAPAGSTGAGDPGSTQSFFRGDDMCLPREVCCESTLICHDPTFEACGR